jgi:hypothetical protein
VVRFLYGPWRAVGLAPGAGSQARSPAPSISGSGMSGFRAASVAHEGEADAMTPAPDLGESRAGLQWYRRQGRQRAQLANVVRLRRRAENYNSNLAGPPRRPSAGVRARRSAAVASGWPGPGHLQSRAGAREKGEDFADGGLLAGGFGQREVCLDLVAVAAAVFLLHHVAGCGQVGDDAVGAALGDAQAGRAAARPGRGRCTAGPGRGWSGNPSSPT